MSFKVSRRIAALLLAATIVPSIAAAAPLDAQQTAQILKLAKAQTPAMNKAALQVWNFAEVGYQEQRSSAVLQAQLKAAGFTVTPGVAGMPTAFVASYRNGDGPVIGILAEFDALPGLAQKAEPVQAPIAGQLAGHGCGHNLFGAASVSAAITVRNWMAAQGVKGEIRVFGAPAEEGGSGKVYLVRDGLFKDVDVALHWHPGNSNNASQGPSLANISGKFRFHGASAHAAGAPDRGRSALDGAQIMTTAVEFLREHVPDGTRIHYVITNGGKAPNVVPDFAEVYLYVRNGDPQIVKDVWARVIKAAEGAALATGTTTDNEITGGVYSLLPNETLMKAMDESLRAVPITPWSDTERAFATKMVESFDRKPATMDPTAIETATFKRTGGIGGSTDVSDISWTVPTVGLSTMTFVPGTPGHSWQATAAAGSPIGLKGAETAAETLALTAGRLLLDREIVAAAKEEFMKARGEDFVYKAMVGDRQPPLDYRKDSKGSE
ncbi:amidohydrolase [Govanella unica]|uniref:Amidohydrolase n=1 Tax=Govanella unica TaxID=2975056 RepID=A0A9X3Z895_9PROT|nr:amidohydrolase [Govania unica]MDA5195002.1 amidohydrolase [Govania unica]